MKALIPIFFTIITVCILLSLGTWQLYRLSDKQALINDIIDKKNRALTNFDDIINLQDKNLVFTRIKVRGKFLPGKDIFLYGKYSNKYILVSPLLTAKGNVVIVARGLIDYKNLNNFLQEPLNSKQDMELTGIALQFEQAKLFIPNNNIQSNVWFSLRKEDIMKYVDCTTNSNFYLLQTSGLLFNHYLRPLQNDLLVKIQNNHLEYAIIWFSLAISVVIIYFFRFFYKTK